MTLRNLAVLMLLSFGASAAEHDFDFAVGNFRSHVRRLQKPLTGSTEWIEGNGTVWTRKVLADRGELEVNEFDQPTGHFEALALRLWNPKTKQWSLHFANARRGVMSPPPGVGEFKDGRGEFYDQEDWDGRTILVRQTFFDITKDSYRFEQAFSPDGGKTWEVNWVADCHRVASNPPTPEAQDRNRDFDYQLGKFRARVSRRNDGKWTETDGTAEVTPLWGGRASMIELKAGALEGLAIRMFNPASKQWNLNWTSAKAMELDVPTFGAFSGGRGEFIDVEPVGGRQIFVRQIFDVKTNSMEQSFSADGMRTWEPNLRIAFEPMPQNG